MPYTAVAEQLGFYEWLEQDPTRKQNLPRWEELRFLFWGEEKEEDSDDGFNHLWKLYIATSGWDRGESIRDYWKIYKMHEEKDDNEYDSEDRQNILVYETFIDLFDEIREFKFRDKRLEEDVENRRDDFLKSLNEFSNDFTGLENLIEGLTEDIPETDEQVSDLKSYEEIEEELNQLKQENADLIQKVKESETTLTAIMLSSGLLSEEKNALETANQNLKQEFDDLKSRLENYEKEIQELLKNKARLEIESEKSAKNNQELKIQLNHQKDKISKLEGDANLITNQLNDLEEELEITSTEEETPENKTLSKKISFFENWWKKTRQEKEEIAKNLQKEQGEIQILRQSLTDLEEQLKNTGDDNLQQMHRLDQENKSLKKKLANHEINLGGEKRKVENLEQDIADWKTQAQKLGLNLTNCQKQIVNQQKENKILHYCLIGAIVTILLGIFYFVYRKFVKLG